MGLFDKFRTPKWKSDDVNVRLKGIEELANDKKNYGKNQEILRDLLKNDSDADVRILAIQNVSSDVAIRDAALTDGDWKVRKAAVETLKPFLDSAIRFSPEDHYNLNRDIIQDLEKVAKNDSNGEVRKAAKEITDNPKYSEKALKKQHENDVKEIRYTVADVSRNSEKTIVLTQNEKFEYCSHLDSVEEIFDYCFGGDIVTVTYSSAHTDLTVDYNILDKHVANADKIPIEGRNFDRVITYEDMASQNLSRNANLLFRDDVEDNERRKIMLLYYLYTSNKFFLVKKGEKLRLKGTDLLGNSNPFSDKPELKLSTDQLLVNIELTVKDIEFVCRKISQMPISENITVYRE